MTRNRLIVCLAVVAGTVVLYGAAETLTSAISNVPDESVDTGTGSPVLSTFGRMPLHFVENQGQLASEVIYYAQSEGGMIYCTEDGVVFGFSEGSIRLMLSAARRMHPEARGDLGGKVNHFLGNDAEKWVTDIPTFREVLYPEVYSGIDVVYSGDQRRLKYTCYVHPGGDPGEIGMVYEGVDGIWVDDITGELVIETGYGEMRDASPVAYQEVGGVRREVEVSFRVESDHRVGFEVGTYDPDVMLVLDPHYSTYLGGSGEDQGRGIAVDSSGNAYVTGYTGSSDFPTQNAYDGSHNGNLDVFVTKLSSDSELIYSTYLGGGSNDGSYGIAVDASGNAYVTGYTKSSDFPTLNAYDGSHNGDYDVFVTKLSSDGNALIYSTYLGGSSQDRGRGIAVDALGNAYVTGYTKSSDFPTLNAYDTSFGGYQDAFVAKLSATAAMKNGLR